MVDDNYAILSRSMYELLNYLRSTPEGRLYNEAGNERPGTGVVCLTPGGKYIHMDGLLREVLDDGKFNLEIILRNAISRKVEASATWNPQRLHNMQNVIKIVDTFLDNEIRSKKN